MREDRQRLDKWLWFARFAKTRTLAAKLVTGGHVRINGQRIDNAARAVAVGDVVTLALPRATLVVRIEGLGERRGPAPEARQLYADLNRDNGPLVSEADKG
ncbi:ribosome-associated heat shock protein Hsp15 [Microvirga flocculans]|uniref:Ribosome-associated heat shock protein Hsp15 n=1 Tax=Microvirga flocculans TaxID=217168 RepID=A0A7W6IFL8_9HYPH|nr:RNA-binding S4 domain-containing protein [Microvirga flocculans]MBB4040572.1 ribosome-associated heat shock protein Hsp15 [Microvirga flocculans]